MQLEDIYAKEIASIIKEQFALYAAQIKTLEGKIAILEAREPERGEKGEAGPKGDRGESITGPIGPTGPKGDEGPPGRDGSSFLIGKGPPHDKLVGQAYLDSESGDLYEFIS